MANSNLTNGKPASATIRDGLIFVLTTLSPTPGKGEDHGFVQPQHTRVQH